MGKCDAGSGVLFSACLPVSSLRSEARCCDAGSRVSPACLPVSPSLCGQMPDAVTPALGSCLPLVSLCLPVSAVRCQMLRRRLRGRVSRLFCCVSQSLPSDARFCDAISGVVSPACLPVSPSLCGQMPDAVTPALGSCLPLVALCLPVSAVRC